MKSLSWIVFLLKVNFLTFNMLQNNLAAATKLQIWFHLRTCLFLLTSMKEDCANGKL